MMSAATGELQGGRDFFGESIETPGDYLRYFLSLFEPIWLEQGVNPYIPYFRRENELPEGMAAGVVTIVGEFWGLRTNPQYEWSLFYDYVNDDVLPNLSPDIFEPFFEEEELVKILKAQEKGTLKWAHLPDMLQFYIRQMYPEAERLYNEASIAMNVRNSDEMNEYQMRVDEDRKFAYDTGKSYLYRVQTGELTTKDLRERWSDTMNNYYVSLQQLGEDYPEIVEYFDKKEAEGEKYDWNIEQALNEYTAVMFADYTDTKGDMDWDARDRAIADYISRGGDTTFGIIRQYFLDKKYAQGLDEIYIKLSTDRDALGEVFWNLPYKPISEMEASDLVEGNIPPEYVPLWLQYSKITDQADRDAFLEEHPMLAKDWRSEWRATNPEADAMLAFWGYAGQLQTMEAYEMVEKWSAQYRIPMSQLGLGLPERELIDEYFSYNDIVKDFSAISAEAKLFRLENPEWQIWGEENRGWQTIDDNIESLRITVQYKAQDVEYDAIKSDDATRQAEMRQLYLDDNYDYRIARRQREAYDYDIADDMVASYVDYFEQPADGQYRERYRLEHPEVDAMLRDVLGYQTIDPTSIKPEEYDDLYIEWKELFDQYADVEGTPDERKKAREAILKANPDFAIAKRRREAYGHGFPEEMIDTYIAYYQKDRAGYEDDRFLMENPEFYEMAKDILGWKERDFSKVPSREMEAKLESYKGLGSAEQKLYVRCNDSELDNWLVRVNGYTPAYGTSRCEAFAEGGEPLSTPAQDAVAAFRRKFEEFMQQYK